VDSAFDARLFWLDNLRRFECLKCKAVRPDRVQFCIDALTDEGKEQGWL